MTATPSSDTFISYRVGLASIRLLTSSGKTGLTVLPTETMVDFTKLTDLSEVLGAAPVAKGTYNRCRDHPRLQRGADYLLTMAVLDGVGTHAAARVTRQMTQQLTVRLALRWIHWIHSAPLRQTSQRSASIWRVTAAREFHAVETCHRHR